MTRQSPRTCRRPKRTRPEPGLRQSPVASLQWNLALNLLHSKITAKDANFLHPLDVQKAKKRLQLQGVPLTTHRGLCPLEPRWGLRPQTPVIGSLALPRSPWPTHFLTPSGAYAHISRTHPTHRPKIANLLSKNVLQQHLSRIPGVGLFQTPSRPRSQSR